MQKSLLTALALVALLGSTAIAQGAVRRGELGVRVGSPSAHRYLGDVGT